MRVEASEDPEGYIILRGKPPPGYNPASISSGTPNVFRHAHYRLKRKESIEMETFSSAKMENPSARISSEVKRTNKYRKGREWIHGVLYNW